MKSERQGTVIPGANEANRTSREEREGSLNLEPDPAGLRDLAARFREDAAMATGSGVKKHFIRSAEEAESRAEAIEASALWSAQVFR